MAIEYIVRDTAGSVRSGAFPEGDPATIYVSFSRDVSLNLGTDDVATYTRSGNDLMVMLQDGRVLILEGYFEESATGPKNLFLSEEGQITEVFLGEAQEGTIAPNYAALDVNGKWSAYDDMVFLDLGRVEPVVAPLAAPLIGGIGGLAAGGAALAGAALIAGGGGSDPIEPTVDDADSTQIIGGTESTTPVVTGTGVPDTTVTVTVNDRTVTTTVQEDGTWTAEFDPDDLPGDGVWEAVVQAEDSEGNTETLDGPTMDIDTTPPLVSVIEGAKSNGDFVNSTTQAEGTVINGTGEVGAAIAVTIDGTTHETVVGEDGTWTVTFTSDEISTGEYEQAMVVTATDARGNSTTINDAIVVDTVQTLTLDASVGGDSTINAAEQAAGVTFNGTAQANSRVEVTLGDVTETVFTDADGNWSATFDAADIPTGTYDATVTAVAMDPYGNVETTSADIRVDTEIAVAVDSGQAGGDDIISEADAAGDITLTGTAEPGASVEVTVAGVTRSASVDADGNWSAVFEVGSIPGGEYDATVTAVATDAAGNSMTSTSDIKIDTVAAVSIDAGQAGGDDIVNADEASGDVTLTGTANPGASVEVTMGGVTRTATVADDGTWAAVFEAGSIPDGTYDTTVTAEATDVAGNRATATADIHVDTEIAVTVDSGQVGGDDIVNEAEAASDITLTGTAEPGSSVEVTVAGVTRSAVVDPSGNWSAVFEAGSIPAGEYDTTVTAVATDAAGNSATSTAAIRVDTVAGDVALSSLPIEIDDVINAVERADGVEISGTATPGLTVTVTLGDATADVVAGADGTWSTTFPASEIPTGTDTLDVTASITDAAGNSKTVSDTVGLDTEVTDFTHTTPPIEGDDVINAAERADGVTLTGTVEPGSTVAVAMGASSVDATVDAFGNWSATFLPGSIPEGSYEADITVTATDAAGNVDTITDTVNVDTDAGLSVEPNQTADDVVNAAERDTGVTLAGTADPGSTVMVTLQGVTRAATVDADGNWTASFTTDELPEGTYTASATIVATDPAGNTATVTESFQVDTQVETPSVDSITYSGGDIRRISTEDATDSYEVNTLEAGGGVGSPAASISSDPTFGTELTFSSPIPDGTNLVVTRTDTAGNSAGTIVLTEDDATSDSVLGHDGVGSFDIAALNLNYGDDTNLVLSEAQIKSLSDSTDTLTIHGGMDDTVTVSGAVNTGTTQTIDGQTYNVYTIGDDGATLVVEQDVNVII